MPRDFEDPPKEPARRKAERRWRNHDIEKRIKEEKAKPAPTAPKEVEVGDVINTAKPKAGVITKAQTKFAKEIKEMLEGHTRRNLLACKLSLRLRIHRLKAEKLKRLQAKAAQQTQEKADA
jgi:hypothetical protein